MALKVAIQQSKEVALWKEYKDSEGNVLAEFKIRGSDYKAYRVAVERAQNQLSSKGYDVATAGSDDKLYHELLLEAAACHLVVDWKGVVFVENDKEIEPECSPENANKLFNMGDIGVAIWAFVKAQADQIQTEANSYRDEVLGKLQNSTDTSTSLPDSVSTK
ncbi:hypothetical protein [Acinetobacter haemolyticus]|uniref:hypothetical protein n=1 Tax=Acinetobacter haemolyticus TaxID=29430 RepID=UPI001331CD8C|nr:hypothetical protein [Acinetobacter haemolyticus]QHI16245.1 hypothetical protein AhaeAN4_06390 [Acinetobacter haemolyticus]